MRLPYHRLREVSVVAGVDPRSVKAVLAGRKVRPLTAERIRRALTELGLDQAAQAEQPAQPVAGK
jgi:hypothetical protein